MILEIKTIFKLTFIYFIFISCTIANHEQVVGSYESYDIGYFELIQNYISNGLKAVYYSKGTTLNLKADSTFSYGTCGNLITGIWSIKKDTLVLNGKTNKYRNDSLNLVLPPPKVGINKFVIDKKKVYSQTTIKHNGRNYTSLTILNPCSTFVMSDYYRRFCKPLNSQRQ